MRGNSFRIVRIAAMAAMLGSLAGCTTSGLFGSTASTNTQANVPDMRGRWTLSSPGQGACVVNFGGGPGAMEGTVAPEGGCPGNFFTSRGWALEQNALVIRNHKGDPLAQLAVGTTGRFDGRAATGEHVTLAR